MSDPQTRAPASALRSPARLMMWLAGQYKKTLIGSILLGIAWVLCQVLWPILLGGAVDAISTGFDAHLVGPLLVLAVLVISQSTAGTLNYRLSYLTYLRSTIRLGRMVGRHITEVGGAVLDTTTSGEVVVGATADAAKVGKVFDLAPRLVGSVLAWLAVAAIMSASSIELGLVALVSVPVASGVLALLIRPLEARQGAQRGKLGALTALGGDAAVGLRVLRGIGGEAEFVARYRSRSQEVRRAGTHLATVQAWLSSAQVLLPGLVVALVVTYGAGLVLNDQWSAGELVTVYGFSAFLALPVATGVEAIATITGANVSARRILNILSIRPLVTEPAAPAAAPPPDATLTDVASGVMVRPGLLTVIVSPDPNAAADIARRLGRYDDRGASEHPVLWGSTPLTDLAVSEVRNRIVVAEPVAHLFTGRLIDGVDPLGVDDGSDDARVDRVTAAVTASAAEDVVSSRREALFEIVGERGRAFSGGERQRLSLARALLSDAEVLVLIEPTSAVDARTEQLIAERLTNYRRGRTTVVVSASPLITGHADEVALLQEGRVVAQRSPDALRSASDFEGELYRAIVHRGEPEEQHAATDR